MTDARYPQLSRLMDTCFNQDFDVHGDVDSALLDGFARSNWADEVAATVAEIDALLATPTPGLLDRFTAATGAGNVLIADDDDGARIWLEQARARLVAADPPRR